MSDNIAIVFLANGLQVIVLRLCLCFPYQHFCISKTEWHTKIFLNVHIIFSLYLAITYRVLKRLMLLVKKECMVNGNSEVKALKGIIFLSVVMQNWKLVCCVIISLFQFPNYLNNINENSIMCNRYLFEIFVFQIKSYYFRFIFSMNEFSQFNT